jgi:hypothetical protein
MRSYSVLHIKVKKNLKIVVFLDVLKCGSCKIDVSEDRIAFHLHGETINELRTGYQYQATVA